MSIQIFKELLKIRPLFIDTDWFIENYVINGCFKTRHNKIVVNPTFIKINADAHVKKGLKGGKIAVV